MKKITNYLGITLAIAMVFSCTDLEIEATDSLITDGFAGVANVQGEVANIQNIIAGGQLANQEGLFALNEVSTDEYIVPTRGTDWGDNGRWLSIHRQTWNAELSDIVNPWQELNSITINATRVISPKSVNTAGGDIVQQKAEARFYRAWAMSWILDMWRQVPYRDVDLPNSATPDVLTGQVAIDSIVADLNAAIQDLPEVTSGDGIALKSTPTKAAARHLLAKVHLNKHVYLGGTAQAADMQVVIDAVDAIAASGYTLAASGDYFDIFRPDNDVETIWWSPADTGPRTWHTLHYNQDFPGFNDGGGWNGFTTLAEFYDLFEGPADTNYPGDGQEERRGVVHDPSSANADNLGIGLGFLINQQYEQDGTALDARENVGGVPLVFTRETEKAEFVSPADDATLETSGIRMFKYHPNEDGGDRRRHIVRYRYADGFLMKAEAMWRMGGDPTAMINELRTTRGASALGTVTEADLLAERGRELYQEQVRRQDLIRFGQYLRAWNLKEAGNENLLIFPIPVADVLANPNLTQNPGY
ncbi:RagB/SusD family nutrient uptake outer membrane protein [Allomuricauda sp. SCSIO 65647]|uniref:RagB/SusD family nutrient uptake outer membrane protein n=1 Tax=Allomuricauda sp. SCSIO 65647 TaxID=2908843 RepID=UPI001F1BA4DE|nr:RagB/SusD family nutrient uptake outer membrane protein [Muricauda sp. SCSIO 65647]UJH66238.1 RagB/SusD family nutrient uptake outer membrane protein [Muricauda sp. SCSIO 65647]